MLFNDVMIPSINETHINKKDISGDPILNEEALPQYVDDAISKEE